jgi:prepilin-type N-terminal cleavage/methylation domain-containing protein
VTSEHTQRRSAGFTLIEVMAAVLVLGLLYTVLAGAAMRGLRSEGIDRRRADAAMIADRELSVFESDLASGVPLEDGLTEREQEPFVVRVDVEPADVLAMLPPDLRKDVTARMDPKAPSVLHDERGKSRIHRVSVVVSWDEAGEPDTVQRTTYALDTSALQNVFPSAATGDGSANSKLDELRKLAPPELKALMPGGAPKKRSR